MCQLLPLVRQDGLLILALFLASVLHEQQGGGGFERAVGVVEVEVIRLDTGEPPVWFCTRAATCLCAEALFPAARAPPRTSRERPGGFHLARVGVANVLTLFRTVPERCRRSPAPMRRRVSAAESGLSYMRSPWRSGSSGRLSQEFSILDTAAFSTFSVCFRHSLDTFSATCSAAHARGTCESGSLREGGCCIPNKGSYIKLYI
jgi:hypothetical protein